MARTRRSCNEYIPEELIFMNILSRLPVKSLLRFKSVCKLWRFILSTTRFVRTHMANSHKNRAVLLNYMEHDRYMQVHDTHESDTVKLYVPSCVAGTSLMNSCDGLVCLSNFGCDVIHIGNPSTKSFKSLPTPNKDVCNWLGLNYLGLGFDPVSNDYKLLRIVFKYTTGPLEAELYSANANSWKNIEIPAQLLKGSWRPDSQLVHAKTGVLYLESDRELLAFDLHSEVFQVYAFPSFVYGWSYVLDFEGHAAMIFKPKDGLALDLYILDDACGKVCWTKMFTLETHVKIDRVVRYLGIGEFVSRNYVGDYSFSHDYKNRETEKVLINLRCSGRQAVKYTESLVCLNGFQHE